VRRIAILVATAALAVWGVSRLWPSETRRVAARWERALELVEKRGRESQLDALARVRGMTELFAPGFAVFAAPYEGTITDRQQLAAIVASYRAGAERIEISDSGRQIEVHPERETADLVATVDVVGLRGGSPGRERFRVRVALRKDAGKWWIHELEILEVLETSGVLF
jgi:hypothetical protein